jgi:hypothetical protein
MKTIANRAPQSPDSIARRLHDGAERIDRAIAAGRHAEAARLEEFWLGLLAEYEALCDAHTVAA